MMQKGNVLLGLDIYSLSPGVDRLVQLNNNNCHSPAKPSQAKPSQAKASQALAKPKPSWAKTL